MQHSHQSQPPQGLLGQSSLFLDFDGTLVDIAPTPDSIEVSPALPDLLEALAALLDGRLALVTGRAVRDVARFLPRYSGIVAGSHGGEVRGRDGRIAAPQRSAGLDSALADARAFAAPIEGITIEDKSFGVGLHYRLVPGCEAAVQAFAAELSERHGLELQLGKMVAELRAPGFDKGSAVARLMAQPDFAGTRPVFIGDDLTDIPAMLAVADRGGHAIAVGELDCDIAHYRLAGVAETLDWLKRECAA